MKFAFCIYSVSLSFDLNIDSVNVNEPLIKTFIFSQSKLNFYNLGFASVLMRQTNIVWVGMALGMTVIDKFVSQTLPFVKDADKMSKVDNVYTFKVNIHPFNS